MKTIILVSSHKKFHILQNEILQPIQVGAIGKENLYALRDDSGDNISAKNNTYCELTAMYWAWKNLPPHYDYVGFFHYRRYLSFAKSILPKFITQLPYLSTFIHNLSPEKIENICSKYEIICIHKTDFNVLSKFNDINPTLKSHFLSQHKQEIFDVLDNLINSKYNKFYLPWQQALDNNQAYFKNIFIMKKDIFAQYCEFLFGILFDLEAILNKNQYSHIKQDRLYGFIAERLLNVFINYLNLDKSRILELPPIRTLELKFNNVYLAKQFNKLKRRLNINYLKTLWYMLSKKD